MGVVTDPGVDRGARRGQLVGAQRLAQPCGELVGPAAARQVGAWVERRPAEVERVDQLRGPPTREAMNGIRSASASITVFGVLSASDGITARRWPALPRR